MSKLAINGGPKVRENLFPDQNTYCDREADMIKQVMSEGRLSGFRGNWCDEFNGGPQVQTFEREFAEKFSVKHAISINSATSGLIVACGAAGLEVGTETIVSPYSMTCSATAPMWYNSVPVFADIERDCFCLDPKSIEERITERTKAIIVVSIFGQPYDHIKINAIAKKHNLIVIEDAAQAPGSFYDGDGWRQYAGTFGDMGVFSFNFGKHITCGEGGMITTNNDDLAMRCKLIRNHAEAVVNGAEDNLKNLSNLIGMNLRMTELDAAIMRVQLSKFDELLRKRKANVVESDLIATTIPPIKTAPIRHVKKPVIIDGEQHESTVLYNHSFYALPYLWDMELSEGIHRDTFINAVKAELAPRETRDGEGVPIGCGYITPLYMMPLFQEVGHQCFAVDDMWRAVDETTLSEGINLEENYSKGSCPNCEALWKDELFTSLYHAPNSTISDIHDVNDAFNKVWENRGELR